MLVELTEPDNGPVWVDLSKVAYLYRPKHVTHTLLVFVSNGVLRVLETPLTVLGMMEARDAQR